MKMYHLNHLIPHKESPLIIFAHENDTPPLIPSTSKTIQIKQPQVLARTNSLGATLGGIEAR